MGSVGAGIAEKIAMLAAKPGVGKVVNAGIAGAERIAASPIAQKAGNFAAGAKDLMNQNAGVAAGAGTAGAMLMDGAVVHSNNANIRANEEAQMQQETHIEPVGRGLVRIHTKNQKLAQILAQFQPNPDMNEDGSATFTLNAGEFARAQQAVGGVR